MGRTGSGFGLLVGVVKAINRSNKVVVRELLHRERVASSQARVQVKQAEQASLRQARELTRSQMDRQKRDRQRIQEADSLIRLQEREAARQSKEFERKQNEATRAVALKHKESERSFILLLKEAVTRELNEADAEFLLRCNQRKNLRLEYLRNTLK